MADNDDNRGPRREPVGIIAIFGPREANSPRRRRFQERHRVRMMRMRQRLHNNNNRMNDNDAPQDPFRFPPQEEEHDDEWLMMMRMEQDFMRMERIERQDRHRREDEARLAAMRPVPLRRGISSFSQESFVFGTRAGFQEPPDDVPVVQGVEKVMACPEFDTKRLFLKRVTACIGWAVHGIVFEFCDNTRVGCILDGFAEKRLDLSDENIEKRLGIPWQNVEYGDYIVGIHGNKLHNETLLWFCHTVILEFASGKTIRFEARHEPWRGEPFAWQVPQPCLVYRLTFRHEQAQDMRGLITTIHLPMSAANMKHLPRKNKENVEEILGVFEKVDSKRHAHGQKPLSEDLWWTILGFIRAWEMPVKEEATQQSNNTEDGLCSQLESLSTS